MAPWGVTLTDLLHLNAEDAIANAVRTAATLTRAPSGTAPA